MTSEHWETEGYLCIGKQFIDNVLADCGQGYTYKICWSSDYLNASGNSCVLFLTHSLRWTIRNVRLPTEFQVLCLAALFCATAASWAQTSGLPLGKLSAIVQVVLNCFHSFCNVLCLFRAPFAQLEELYKINSCPERIFAWTWTLACLFVPFRITPKIS